MNDTNALFPLGTILLTPGAMLKLFRFGVDGWKLLRRHQSGDFGNLCDEDRTTNLWAIASGGRVFSCYEIAPGTRLYVITEADRSATTLLLPSEY